MIILIRDNVEKIVDTEEKAKIKESQGFKRLRHGESTKPAKPAERSEKPLSAMTKQELIAYAYEHEVDINPRDRKADILAALMG